MKRMMVLAIAGVAVAAAAINPPAPLGSGAIDWNDPLVRRQAILETAYAYYLKADCVQYGSVPLVVSALYKDVGWLAYSRRDKERTPEDATPDSTYFTVCSSFPYETYFNAIGYKLSGAADTSVTIILTTRPQDCVVFDYDKRLDPDGSKYEPEMMRLRSLLEPGDVLVYSTIKWQDPKTGKADGGGHALMYVGDVAGDGHPMVMHSGGAKYQFENGGYDQVEKSGTIRLDDFDACFFHGPSMKKHTKIMALRPLALPAEKYPLSDSAKARYLHPRLRIDRCVDVGPYGSVVTGGELNYSITLKNFSKTSYTVPVRETIPAGCELVSYEALPDSNPQRLAGTLALPTLNGSRGRSPSQPSTLNSLLDRPACAGRGTDAQMVREGDGSGGQQGHCNGRHGGRHPVQHARDGGRAAPHLGGGGAGVGQGERPQCHESARLPRGRLGGRTLVEESAAHGTQPRSAHASADGGRCGGRVPQAFQANRVPPLDDG